ncbi:MAG: hypothetical protein ACLFQX_08950 [Candidatus Kapaibacterium sp.]
MKVIGNKEIKGCLEGTNVRDWLLDGPITHEFIYYLGELGKLIYNDKLPKPFFKLIIRGKMTVKGAEGNQSIRLVLPEDPQSAALNELKEHIENF